MVVARRPSWVPALGGSLFLSPPPCSATMLSLTLLPLFNSSLIFSFFKLLNLFSYIQMKFPICTPYLFTLTLLLFFHSVLSTEALILVLLTPLFVSTSANMLCVETHFTSSISFFFIIFFMVRMSMRRRLFSTWCEE